MYSQNKEDAVIGAYFASKIGRFLDIGAYDGIRLSNTRKLLENGWSGTYVEPSPPIFGELLSNTMDYIPYVKLWNTALTHEKSGMVMFHDSLGDAISTISDKHIEKWKQHSRWRSFMIHMTNVIDFFDVEGTDFDFLSLDVEGLNYEILMAMPYALLSSVQMICIEYDDKMQELTDYITSFGFKVVHRNAENLIFAKS